MQQYKDLINKILTEGEDSGDRTGTGTTRIFGHYMSFDLRDGFPLLTLKKTHLKSIVYELLWFIDGSTNIKYLTDNGVKIWNEWATKSGSVGPMYGAQWRNAGGKYRNLVVDEWAQDGVDQLQNAIDLIKNNPSSRRIIVDAWTVRQLPDDDMTPQQNATFGLMALAPCHMMFQLFVHNDGQLDMNIYQRSVDSFLGLPFNIASYALLLEMIAQVTGKIAGKLNWIGGDIHIYNNHREQVKLMMSREPLPLPKVELNTSIKNINDFTYKDISLFNYQPHPGIKAPISV